MCSSDQNVQCNKKIPCEMVWCACFKKDEQFCVNRYVWTKSWMNVHNSIIQQRKLPTHLDPTHFGLFGWVPKFAKSKSERT